ncbi:MAG: hypothetical protein HQK51_12880 [Oligoflexia bacterium]|nr:hypothetical protein [Oligoflexia bacterium]
MNLSVAYNFDPHLITKLKAYPVTEIFGSIDYSLVGSHRPGYALPNIKKEQLEKSISLAHKYNIQFNYLLNAFTLAGNDFDPKFQNELKNFLGFLREIHVDKLTITNPFLMEFVRRNYPSFDIKASIVLGLNYLTQINHLLSLGINNFTLHFHQNRNFQLIRQLLKRGFNITLLTNDGCIYHCPYYHFHACNIAYSSQKDKKNKNLIDYYMLKCNQIKNTNPSEFLKIRWIRPEDIPLYESFGIREFKVAGRSRSSEWILKTVDAYSKCHYNGNLLDLLEILENNPNPLNVWQKQLIEAMPPWWLSSFLKMLSYLKIKAKYTDRFNKLPALTTKTLMDLYIHLYYPYLDNKTLNGFINFFIENNCDLNDCMECNYCSEWSKKCIKNNQQKSQKYAELLEKILDQLTKLHL